MLTRVMRGTATPRKAPQLDWAAMRAAILAHRDRLKDTWRAVRSLYRCYAFRRVLVLLTTIIQCHTEYIRNNNMTLWELTMIVGWYKI